MNWTEVIQAAAKQDASLTDAFSALSISRVGQGHRDVRLVHESAKLYGKALKELQYALFDAKRMHSDHVLMACMLLGLYEIFEGPALNSRSWITHAAGAARLVELRGPERHQHWDAHHPFLASRIPTVYAAIVQRQATYLATEEWLTIPWEFQHRTYFDRMVDLGTLVPGILQRFDTLQESTADTTEDLLALLDECRDLRIRMEKWKDGTKKGALPRSIPHDSADPEYPFETDLWFENHLFVHARLVYYSCSLALSEVGLEILQSLILKDRKLPRPVDVPALKELFDMQLQATRIVRCVPYCLHPEMGAWGANIINFPANLAFTCLRRAGNTAATEWLTNAFQSAKARGLHVDNVFTDMLPQNKGKDVRASLLKRESSEDSSESGSSPISNRSFSSTATTIFVYEDPSKGYYDASNDPG
jgi:hypothetical protein